MENTFEGNVNASQNDTHRPARSGIPKSSGVRPSSIPQSNSTISNMNHPTTPEGSTRSSIPIPRFQSRNSTPNRSVTSKEVSKTCKYKLKVKYHIL